MARGKRAENPKGHKSGGDNGAGLSPAPLQAPAPPAVGGNVNDQVMCDFEKRWRPAKVAEDGARKARQVIEKEGKGLGIDMKQFKRVQKLKDLLPPEAEAEIHTFTRYTKQLGLDLVIQQHRQAVDHEDNEASVRQAEKAIEKSAGANKAAGSTPSSASAHAEGYALGKAGQHFVQRYDHPLAEHFENGWKDGQADLAPGITRTDAHVSPGDAA